MCIKITSVYACTHPMSESSWEPANVLDCPAAARSRVLNRDGTVQRCGAGRGNYENFYVYRATCDDCWSTQWLIYHGWLCCQCINEMEPNATKCASETCGHEVCDECHARYDCDCSNCGAEINQDENWCTACGFLAVPPHPSLCHNHPIVTSQYFRSQEA
ncbi:hypothetical protein PpBr36_04701 [Pyricularia pennisetigena]|uniref:hypothetical protein n=1 Tax=Pyricularia pennisetigena TaxID=1578925 RepID=UPI00114FC23C|nr:hypothetical protein PpBr36_04701 [Pyricularia pennisetigena]TLS26331.1 hypothetical protein PpBr36_04701 [Pyricularia pennisetigena]